MVVLWKGDWVSGTVPSLRRMSIAAFRLVPAPSMNVSGKLVKVSVSLGAIQVHRAEREPGLAILAAFTMWNRATPSVEAQPTQEPVMSRSPMPPHSARRSTWAGKATGAAAMTLAPIAWSTPQSRPMPRMGGQVADLISLGAVRCWATPGDQERKFLP